MRINNAGLELIKQFEGLRLSPYLDSVSIPTIGIGCTHYEDGSAVTMNDAPISEDRATQLLQFHIAAFEKVINDSVTASLTSNQFSALVCFTYNVGPGNFKSSTLLKKVNIHDSTAKDEFLRWNRAGGNVIPGLTRRRQAESDLFSKTDSVVQSSGDQLSSGPSDQDINNELASVEK